jgi:hypothetical protein
MSDDWLNQLQQLRDADKTKHQPPVEIDVESQRKQQAVDLLRKSRAHELLRQVQKTLLGGQGTLDFFDRKGDYERVISLVWQGPISEARRPDPDDSEPYNYILVGVRKETLWVNGKKVAEATPEALKAALLEACRKPGRAK